MFKFTIIAIITMTGILAPAGAIPTPNEKIARNTVDCSISFCGEGDKLFCSTSCTLRDGASVCSYASKRLQAKSLTLVRNGHAMQQFPWKLDTDDAFLILIFIFFS